MCLVVFNWRPEHAVPLLLAANRDEFYARPAKPFHWWQPQARYENGLLAGVDLKAHGTWTAFDRKGRFALLTNIRPGFIGVEGQLTRGEIPVNYIASGLDAFSFGLSLRTSIADYAGFNLLLGEPGALYWMSSNHPEPKRVLPGIHGLSNDALDTPWPKVELAKQQMQRVTTTFEQGEWPPDLLTDTAVAPDENLPDTGIPLDWERLLSAQTIISESYGTRSRCLFKIEDHTYKVWDQQLDTHGQIADQTYFQWALEKG